MEKLEAKDICAAYLEGYFYAKITEQLITSKILSSDLNPSLTLWGNFHKFLVIFSS